MQKPRYCWDSCIFIAVLTGEPRTEDELHALKDVMDQIDRKEVVLVTSVLIRTEVLDAFDSHTMRKEMERFLLRSNVVEQPVTPGIGTSAGEIRAALGRKAIKIKAPDAIFVATAIAHDCDALHTYDEGILRHSERPEVSGLKITKPSSLQLGLRL